MSQPLQWASYLAPNWLPFYEAIAQSIHRQLQHELQIHSPVLDPLIDPVFLDNALDLVFLCGLPFIRHDQQFPNHYQPVVAPVMQADRYGDRPIYFSDVIVHVDSAFAALSDLVAKMEDLTFCYNDLGSNSGYHLVRHWFYQHHYPALFLRSMLQSGSHQASIQWVASGKADWAAIDSTVLQQAQQADPSLTSRIQIIASLGPSPMPPLVAAQRLGEPLHHQIRNVLLHPDALLQHTMQQFGVQRFAAVQVEDYGAIAQIYQNSQRFGASETSAHG
jgi:phosphonate transport system substrate-binding protein